VPEIVAPWVSCRFVVRVDHVGVVFRLVYLALVQVLGWLVLLTVSAHGIPQLQGFDAHVIPHPLT
jgi:hypothetical protein